MPSPAVWRLPFEAPAEGPPHSAAAGSPSTHTAPPHGRAPRLPASSPRPRPAARPRATFSGPRPESNGPASRKDTGSALLTAPAAPSPSPVGLGSAEGRGGGGGAGARTPARPPGMRAASPGAMGKGPPSPATDALPRTEQEDELASLCPSCCPEAPSSPLASLRPRREQKMALSRGPSPTPAPSSDQALGLGCRVHVEVGASIRGSISSKREAH